MFIGSWNAISDIYYIITVRDNGCIYRIRWLKITLVVIACQQATVQSNFEFTFLSCFAHLVDFKILFGLNFDEYMLNNAKCVCFELKLLDSKIINFMGLL